MDELSRWLKTTGACRRRAVAEGRRAWRTCGMMAIKAAIEARGEQAPGETVLVPDSAHGTNPATAALIGFEVEPCRRARTASSIPPP